MTIQRVAPQPLRCCGGSDRHTDACSLFAHLGPRPSSQTLTTAHGIALHEAPLYEAELPRTGYRPAVDYLADALQGQGRAIAKHVDSHLTNERVLDLAAAVNRAIAVAVRQKLEEVAADVLALQLEVPPECEAVEHGR
jgi:DNA-binding FrmR family transcriptional regulator